MKRIRFEDKVRCLYCNDVLEFVLEDNDGTFICPKCRSNTITLDSLVYD